MTYIVTKLKYDVGGHSPMLSFNIILFLYMYNGIISELTYVNAKIPFLICESIHTVWFIINVALESSWF